MPPPLQPHQVRVMDEAEELSERILKLETFISGGMFLTLPVSERVDMIVQLHAMHLYLGALSSRMRRFQGE